MIRRRVTMVTTLVDRHLPPRNGTRRTFPCRPWPKLTLRFVAFSGGGKGRFGVATAGLV